MKKKNLLITALFLLLIPFACKEEEDNNIKDVAKKASKEFCDCYEKNNSLDDDEKLKYCEEQLNSNYSSYVNNDAFYSAFNNANECGITITKKTE